MPTDMEREVKTRKPKTSPRENAFKQVITLIDAQVKSADNHDVETALTSLREQVQSLIGTQLKPKNSKSDDEMDDEGETVAGYHFAGVQEDGKVVYVHKDQLDTKHDLTALFGPFRTAAGVEYSIVHDTFRQRPQVQL